MSVSPKDITVNKSEAFLQITWTDESVCQYPLDHLREACPCVECRGGHQYMGNEYAPDNILELKPARSYTLESVHLVGNYALQPIWSDGHSTGIYTWGLLQKLCPPTLDE